jgi:chemotaxis protein methyltransferase CheR
LRRLGETFVYEVAGRTEQRATAPPSAPRLPVIRRRTAPPVAAPIVAPPPTADHFVQRGQLAIDERDLNAAVVAFRKAAYLSPDDAGIALHLAFALESLGDIDGARPWFRRALETMAAADPSVSVLDGWSTPDLTVVLERKVAAPMAGP